MVLLVENTVGIGGSRSHAEDITLKTRRIIVHIIQLRTSLVPSCNHSSHTETIATVLVPTLFRFCVSKRCFAITWYWRVALMRQRLRYAPYYAVQRAGTGDRDCAPRIGSQQHHQPLFLEEKDWSRWLSLQIAMLQENEALSRDKSLLTNVGALRCTTVDRNNDSTVELLKVIMIMKKRQTDFKSKSCRSLEKFNILVVILSFLCCEIGATEFCRLKNVIFMLLVVYIFYIFHIGKHKVRRIHEFRHMA